MEELKINTKERFIKLNTEIDEYKIKIPRVKERLEFKKKYEKTKDENAQFELLLDYLENLGLPSDVAESMYMEDLIKLTELIGGNGKK